MPGPVVYTPPTGQPYDTGQKWIDRTRSHLAARYFRVRLNGDSVDSTQEQITLDRAPITLAEGSLLSFGLETMYVWTYDPVTMVATVERGIDGSPQITHAGGDLGYSDPRWTDHTIWLALQEEVVSLAEAGVWPVAIIEREWNAGIHGVDLADDMIGTTVLKVEVKGVGDNQGTWRDVKDFGATIGVDESGADGYPSTKVLYFASGFAGGDRLRITYRCYPGQLQSLTADPCQQTNLPYTAADIPPIGAAIRCLANQPVLRANPTQAPGGRPQGEQTTNDQIQSAAPLRVLYQKRIGEERMLLVQGYPVRLKVRSIGRSRG